MLLVLYSILNDFNTLNRFEAVPVDQNFPLGVKTTYRRYSEEVEAVPEIKMYPNAPCGFREEFCEVHWYPEKKPATATTPEQPAGMYFMSEYPKCDSIQPDGFEEGSRKQFEDTFRKISEVFGPGVVRKWTDFSKDVPQSDSVIDYVTEHPEKL